MIVKIHRVLYINVLGVLNFELGTVVRPEVLNIYDNIITNMEILPYTYWLD